MSIRKKVETAPASEAAPERLKIVLHFVKARTAIRAFFHNWQELAIWKPLLLLGMLLLFWFLPALDPRSGIDGFGDLFHLVKQLVVLSAIAFSAWLLKRTYLRELSEEEEAKIAEAALAGDRNALRMLILDRVEFLVLACLIYIVLNR